MDNSKAERISTVLRFIAAQYGYHHTTSWYIKKLQELTQRTCTRQNVCQVLGNAKQRHQLASKALQDAGRHFLGQCGGDASLAKKVVAYVAR
jgi:tartrate dehydratase beta subunit/fumarate hydratase class I family protein